MSNPIDIFDTSFFKLPHIELAILIINIADAFAVHPGFQIPFPSTVPDPKELNDIGTHYNVLSIAAKSGDRGKMAERDAFRPKAVQHSALMLTWAAMRSLRENDPSLISNLGVEPKKKAQSKNRTHSLVEAPKGIQAIHSRFSGAVTVSVAKVPGAILYMVQACQGDPTKDESWSHVTQSPTCKGIEMTGLEPGKMYYFRVRCYGHAGYGPWSAIVSLMAI